MRRALLVTTFLSLGMGAAHAADLVLPMAEPTAVVDTSFVQSPIYIQLLGGATFGLDATFYRGDAVDVPDPTRVGYAVAGTIGVVVYNGFSIEGDVMYTHRNEVAAGDDEYATTSFMGNVKYTAHLTDMFSLYGAAGLGYIMVDNYEGDLDTSFELSGFGYQLIAGAGVQLTDNIGLVAEYRYQDSFQNYDIDGPLDPSLDLPTSTVLAGVKIGF